MSDSTPEPSSAVRTAINIFLMIHFVFIGVAVVSNFQPSSSFWQRLQNIPFTTYYAQVLSQDITYNRAFSNFALTNGQFSHDFRSRVVIDWQDEFENNPAAVAEQQQLELMPEGTWPAIRRQRYLQLNKFVALGQGDPSTESLVPQAIVNHLLSRADELDTSQLSRHRYQCNARLMQDLPNLRSDDPDERNPRSARYLAPRYQADIVRTRDGWALNKVAGRTEVTQVQGNETSSPPASNSQGDR